MNSPSANLIANSLNDLTGAFTLNQLQIFLLIGTSVLAIALMLLTLTRWGHARPIWKCVFLSIGAHVLLITYAYGTHLISKVPETAKASSDVKITLIDEPVVGEELAESGDLENEEVAPWDQIGSLMPRPSIASFSPLSTTVPASSDIDVPERLESSFQPEFSPAVPEFKPRLEQPADELASVDDTPEPFELPDLSSDVEFQAEIDSQVAEMVAPVPPPADEPVEFDTFETGLDSDLVDPAAPDPQSDSLIATAQSEETQRTESDGEVQIDPAKTLQEDADAQLAATKTDENESTSEKDLKADSELQTESETESGKTREAGMLADAAATGASSQTNEDSNERATGDSKADSTNQVASPIAETDRRRLPAQQVSDGLPVKRIADGQKMPTLYQARTEGSKLEVARKRGGSAATEEAVERALKWLAAQQEADGRWNPRQTEGGVERMVLGHNRQGAGANADAGITSLAVLAFLAHGHTHLEGKYRETVQHGLEFLVRNQQFNGDLAGNASFFARTYCHSMALLAICEALAITGDQRLKPAAQRGVDFTVKTQNPNDGGWRYRYGDAGDMSQFGWIVLALHSAELGGLSVPMQTRDKMKLFLDSCTRGRHKGLASYRPREEITESMTAEAFVCRNFLQKNVSSATRNEAAERIIKNLPGDSQVNLYYWYYGTLAMYNAGGDHWEKWNGALTQTLVSSQLKEGRLSGSWEPDGLWAGYGGRVYSTAMSTLCLEVYYRYLPMFEVAELERVRSPLRNARRSRPLR